MGIMKRLYVIGIALILALAVSSCAPVIRKDLMDAGIRDVPLSEVKQKPDVYAGKLFILGGIIASTKVTPEGSQIEALYVPVDSLGNLRGGGSDGRYLALFPKESGMLDPVVYSSGRKITVAGELQGTRPGKIDGTDYVYPFFLIKEIYLWEERMYFYPTPYYYYPYYYTPYWWEPPYPLWWGESPWSNRSFWW
jgi:outer membrane lipoprotein